MNMTSVNEIRASFADINEQVGDILEMLADQIKDQAHPEGAMAWLQHCSKELEIIQRDQKALKEAEEHLIEVLKNTLGFSSDRVAVSASGLRSLVIEVSQGMINQHLLTLTDAKRMGKVTLGEQFKVRLPDGTTFKTDLCDPGNKLRERSLIRRFYESVNAVEGDKITMKEETPGNWVLLKGDDGLAEAEMKALMAGLEAGESRIKPSSGKESHP